jgi:hypothetical protein
VARWMYEGSQEWVWAKVIENEGLDLAPATFRVLMRPDRGRPEPDDENWREPEDMTGSGPVRRLGLLVTGTRLYEQTTKWWIWVLVTDNPEVQVKKAGYFVVR